MTLSSIPTTLPAPYRSLNLTKEQLDCVRWTTQSTGNLIIEAVAGSGKTFTIIEMIVEIVLSRIALGHRPSRIIALMAFNSKVAKELSDRINARNLAAWVTVGTVHKFGKDAFELSYPKPKIDERFKPKIPGLLDPLLKAHRIEWKLTKVFQSAIALARDTGIGILLPNNTNTWKDLIEKHDIAFDEDKVSLSLFISICQTVLEKSNAIKSQIDFSDMIYLPLLENLPFPQFDFVFIDEAQDTNATRREVAKRMLKQSSNKPLCCEKEMDDITTQETATWGEAEFRCAACNKTQTAPLESLKNAGRLICVGDRHQAIYGFTGADNDALDIIKQEFNSHYLPLSVCFRCSTSVIAHARQLVNHIHAKPNAVEGTVTKIKEFAWRKNLHLTPGIQTHAILCRKNAPLISLAFQLLRDGTPCRIEGRDVGEQLISLCKKSKTHDKPSLIAWLSAHLRQQQQKLSPYAFETLQDKVFCITTVINLPSIRSLEDFYSQIKLLFSDYDPSLPPRLTLSSVHKSKGLEWPTVHLLGRNAWMPSPFAVQEWMQDQETNLTYVAITRAQVNLIEVIVEE